MTAEQWIESNFLFFQIFFFIWFLFADTYDSRHNKRTEWPYLFLSTTSIRSWTFRYSFPNWHLIWLRRNFNWSACNFQLLIYEIYWSLRVSFSCNVNCILRCYLVVNLIVFFLQTSGGLELSSGYIRLDCANINGLEYLSTCEKIVWFINIFFR